jgi:hypothetical protein
MTAIYIDAMLETFAEDFYDRFYSPEALSESQRRQANH